MGGLRAALAKPFLPLNRVGWKLMAPFVVLTVLVGVAGSWLATRHVTGSLENHLLESARVASDALVRQEDQQLALSRTVAFTKDTGAAARTGDTAYLEVVVAPIAANAEAERVEMLDTDGRVLFAAGSAIVGLSGAEPVDRSGWFAVHQVVSGAGDALGDKFAQIGETESGLTLLTVAPLYDGDELVGAVAVGTAIQTILAAAQLEALADIAVYDFDGAALTTTFAGGVGANPALGASLETASLAGSGSPVERGEVAGRSYALMYGELTIRGAGVGLFSVALPEDFIVSAGAVTRLQKGGLFGTATAIVLVTGWLIARRFTKPIEKLSETARAVSAGDLSARTGLRGADEIGQFATTFDSMTARVERQHLGTIRALASAIDARDPYTLGHSVRVGQLSVAIGQQLRVPDALLKHLEVGGYLHDIGKIGIRDAVLLKPGALSPEERALIEEHPVVGLQILQHVDLPDGVLEFVGAHHEKLDGSGYPRKLDAEELGAIPRIGAVADIYDALTTDRPYRAGMSLEEALALLRREGMSGKLDPTVVRAFEGIVEEWEARVLADSSLEPFSPIGETALVVPPRVRLRPNRESPQGERAA